MSETILITVTIEAQVDLPEGIDQAHVNSETGELDGEQRDRAFEALSACIPQRVEVFIDGLEAKPAIVFIECSDADAEMRVE